MQAVVYIDKEIGKDIKGEGKEINLDYVKSRIEKYQAAGEVDSIKLIINCVGGSPNMALNIAYYLKGLGIPLETHVDGVCASAATALQLVAEPSKRYATSKSTFRYHTIHYPILKDVDKTALQDRLEALAEFEAGFIKYYCDNIPMPVDEALMLYTSDITLKAEEVKALGIISKIKDVKKAKEVELEELQNLITSIVENENKFDFDMEVKDKLLALIGLKKQVDELRAMEIALADGTKITTNGVDVGNEVFVGEDLAPDGEHTLEDGRKIITEGGKIKEVIEAISEGGSELEDLKAENAKLKAMCTELEDKMKGYGEMANKVKEYDEIVPASVAKIEELQNKVAEKNKQIDELQARIIEKSVPAGTTGGAVAKTWQPTPQWELRKQDLTNNKQF